MSKRKDPYQRLLEDINIRLLGIDREIHELIRVVNGARADPYEVPKVKGW